MLLSPLNKETAITSRLYFWMLYCTGIQLTFMGWFCSTEPISFVTIPISTYVGQAQLEPLLLTLSGRHQRNIVGKGMVNLPGQVSLLHMNYQQLTLAACLSWSVEIQVTNVIDSINLSESKQLGYIFACCFAVVPRTSLLAGFAVQILLIRMEEGIFWEYGCSWHHRRTLRKNLGGQG